MYKPDKKSDIPDQTSYSDPSLVSKLQTSQEWIKLTPLQQKIAIEHFTDPTLSRKVLAEKVSCSYMTVHNFFHTKAYDYINRALAKQNLREMVPKALKAYNELIETGPFKVRKEIAETILFSEGILKKEPPAEIDDNAKLVWEEDERSDSLKEDEKDSNSVQPPQETS